MNESEYPMVLSVQKRLMTIAPPVSRLDRSALEGGYRSNEGIAVQDFTAGRRSGGGLFGFLR
jgi:hypothetical protein